MRRVVGILIVLVIVGLGVAGMMMASTSPTGAANGFLTAFSRGDAKGCVQYAYLDGMTDEQAEAAWKKTLHYAEHFRFAWRIKGESIPNPNEATVDMEFVKTADAPSAYPENYSLPMIKINGKWKVDARQINRTMIPALPR
jgi:hypothetical protein